jgi:very-short-patch-repair endonuclease
VKSGYSVEAQVGSAGFLIDLAVYDPVNEGHFLLGIECDGARYHSSRWARERDRLRQIVLESKGWIIHRIWSTDWFQKPEAEIEKLLKAIDAAQVRQPGEVARKFATATATIEREPIELESVYEPVRYIEAAFDIIESTLHELHEASSESLVRHINRIVQEEGPIHVDEVGRRLSKLWGYQRAGKRVQDVVSRGIRDSVSNGHIQYCPIGGNEFVDCMNRTGSPAVRDRTTVSSSTLRKVPMFPPSEVQAAILKVIDQNIAISNKECVAEVARLFGLKSSRAEFRNLVDQHVEQLLAVGKLVPSGAGITIASLVPT